MTWRRGNAKGPTGPSSEASQQWLRMLARICSATAKASRPAWPLTRGCRGMRGSTLDKVLLLQRQGVDGVEGQLLARQVLFGKVLALMFELLWRQLIDVELPPAQGFAGPDQRRGPAGEVDAGKRPGRPCLHPPDGLVAYAAGRKRGHAATLEFEPRIGHVLVTAENGNAKGLDFPQRGLRTSDSTRSMSWIIKSSTTPTSIERKVNPLARTASIYLGWRSSAAAAWKAGLNRSTWPT